MFRIIAFLVSLGFSSSAWSECKTVELAASNSPGGFGASVAIDGSIAAVGATGDHPTSYMGAVYTYNLVGPSFVEDQKLMASDPIADAKFGHSISLSGSILVVGAPGADGVVPEAGAAYVFEKLPSGWVLSEKITVPDGTSSAAFGSSVSLSPSGDRLAIAAPGDDAAYIFESTGGSWSQTIKLTKVEEPEDQFGYQLSLGDDRLAVSSVGTFSSGTGNDAVYIYEKAGPSWTEVAKLTGSGQSLLDRFGASVSLRGDRVAVGAPHAAAPAFQEGEAYIFDLKESAWVETQIIRAGSPTLGGWFGYSIALYEDGLIAGSPFADTAHEFRFQGDTWTEVNTVSGKTNTFENFGWSVAKWEDRHLVGAFHTIIGSVKGSGYMFSTPQMVNIGASSISISTGGIAHFAINAGPSYSNPGTLFMVLGSLSGNQGVSIGKNTAVPLTLDPYFEFTLNNPSVPPLINSIGFLQGGSENAFFSLAPGQAPQSLSGQVVDHAVFVVDPAVPGSECASAAIPVNLVD